MTANGFPTAVLISIGLIIILPERAAVAFIRLGLLGIAIWALAPAASLMWHAATAT